MNDKRKDEIHSAVRSTYAATADSGGCCGSSSCCTTPATISSERLGYSAEALGRLPVGADLGLGCGNPQAIADLKSGETVLDLGSGAGIDCFLAARAVGETGRVIGIDMTPEMIRKAEQNRSKGGYHNVEFHLAEIEQLPLSDNSIDVIISNCVINLSPDKPQVFREAYRVLKPGGRLAISDVVVSEELPDEIRNDIGLYSGCIAGATTPGELERMLRDSGFHDVRIQPRQESRALINSWMPEQQGRGHALSATIEAIKSGDNSDETGKSTG